jgi:hypothetical protein
MLFIGLSNSHKVHSQDTLALNSELLESYTQYFTLENQQFQGVDSLLSLIDKAQFVALGEIHNSHHMSLFTSALLDTASHSGFQHFAIETGPYSAEKLEELITKSKSKVSAFYDNYAYPLFGIYPIPFFTGQADLAMLQTAHTNGYNLWGVDQEFYFSVPFLLDEMIKNWEGKIPSNVDKAHHRLKRSLYWMQIRSNIFSSYDMSCRLKKSKKLASIFQEASQQQEKVSKLADYINTSLNIYCLAESGSWGESNEQRLAYFNQNFDRIMTFSDSSKSNPKVILKMGSYHSGREKSPLGLYDIGHHIQKWADSLNTTSLHLRFLNRYIDGEDKMEDPNYSISKNFMSMAEKDQWTLIDVRPLRIMLEEEQLQASDFEKREILNYDFILVMPEDTRAERHY